MPYTRWNLKTAPKSSKIWSHFSGLHSSASNHSSAWPPSCLEVAVKGLKNNKSAGPDGIPVEVFKHGGHHLIHRLRQFIHRAWTTGKLPQQWKDATIVPSTKRNGTDKSVAIVVAFPCCRALIKTEYMLCYLCALFGCRMWFGTDHRSYISTKLFCGTFLY